jgi:hypothetical protein
MRDSTTTESPTTDQPVLAAVTGATAEGRPLARKAVQRGRPTPTRGERQGPLSKPDRVVRPSMNAQEIRLGLGNVLIGIAD